MLMPPFASFHARRVTVQPLIDGNKRRSRLVLRTLPVDRLDRMRRAEMRADAHVRAEGKQRRAAVDPDVPRRDDRDRARPGRRDESPPSG